MIRKKNTGQAIFTFTMNTQFPFLTGKHPVKDFDINSTKVAGCLWL